MEAAEQPAAPVVSSGDAARLLDAAASDATIAPAWSSFPMLAMPAPLEVANSGPSSPLGDASAIALAQDQSASGKEPMATSADAPEPPEPKTAEPGAAKTDAANSGQTPATASSPASGDAGQAAKRAASNAAARQADAQLISRGQAAFERSCVDCHDAERSTQKRKSRAAWMGTIRRMASMDGADIPSSDFTAIAAYLASLYSTGNSAASASQASTGAGGSEGGEGGEGGAAGLAAAAEATEEGMLSGISLGGTVSTLWRGGNDNLETPGFFPDVWLTAAWQPSGPLSGRVTACTSCHSDRSGGTGFTFELVEASASFDLLHSHKERRREAGCEPECEWGAEIKAGRLVVPFGAFASMSHPGVYRTITNPLIYNMGRQVNAAQNRPPVLPMPYSDEGADLSLRVPLIGEVYATADLYAVNGLQGFGPGVQFSPSRSYVDNNSEPAIGGRATVGTSDLRVGGSVMSGRMQEEGSTPLGYKQTGADATWRFKDLLRTYFEYAIRANDNDISELQQMIYGIVAESEVLLWSEPDIHFLLRYDTLEYRDRLGEDSTDRITWGFNTTLPGGSLLILNHERWRFHTESPDVDVVGLRWVVTF